MKLSLLYVVVCASAVIAQEKFSGAGIASKYVGDAGIERDSAVIFADR